MKETKPKPRASKLPVREPAKPLEQPEAKLLDPNHPIFSLIGPAQRAQAEPSLPTPRTPPTPPTDATHPISPERDFTKVPNSVARDVVPAGHFVGKSKQLYDCLYQRTRGAIVPARRVAISKPELMKASGIGSERTLLKNVGHLRNLGLIQVTYTDGGHEGNTYEVFTPEEVGLRISPTPPTPPTPRHARVELPPVPPVESGVRGVGSEPLESSVYELPKTFIKTNTENDDDEAAPAPPQRDVISESAFTGLCELLAKATREITGKPPEPIDRERWREIGEVLATELRIVAGRTTVSSVPALLAEHLRRRLWKKDKRQVEAEAIERREGPAAKVDASECPDCFGTGMFYPEGFDKGVARCGHEKVTPKDSAGASVEASEGSGEGAKVE
ncbi:MAG TPA: hypothetical protein VM936_19445 [Pyrinomonadaceae bacterium]|jgi:hypothetical protein|nr:hypothetical protein [Pyrinomonadaceae bacterium]